MNEVGRQALAIGKQAELGACFGHRGGSFWEMVESALSSLHQGD
jgi:hypothetical protein